MLKRVSYNVHITITVVEIETLEPSDPVNATPEYRVSDSNAFYTADDVETAALWARDGVIRMLSDDG